MIKQIYQVEKNWPKTHTTPTAIIGLEPDAITARWGITWEEAYTGLDNAKIAIIEMPNGKQFCLLQHIGCIGTDINTAWQPDFTKSDPFFANMDVVEKDVMEVLEFLGLTRSDLTWLKGKP